MLVCECGMCNFLCESGGEWPRYSLEAITAEAKRMREEGLIVDYESPHGTVTMMKHPLFEVKQNPKEDNNAKS